MIKAEDIFKIGRFYKPHGIAGEINFTFSDDVFDRTESPYWIVEIDGIYVPFFVESYRFRTETTALVKMEDIDDEKAAKLLADHDVFYPKAYADDTDEASDIPSWHYFEGFRIESPEGNFIGEVTAVDDTTINVLFRLKISDGNEILVPAAEDFMMGIDRKHRILVMRFPEGLLDLDEE